MLYNQVQSARSGTDIARTLKAKTPCFKPKVLIIQQLRNGFLLKTKGATRANISEHLEK
jgi:hypothetical protein